MRVLHVEDSLPDAELIHALVVKEWPACILTCVASRDALISQLEHDVFDVVLSDFTLPAFGGMEALELVKERAPTTPFIFVSGTIGEDRAIEAVRNGAYDYVLKDRLKGLVPAIGRAMRDADERRQRRSVELQFLRAQRMENLGLLAAGIAHDLNNTLAPILLAAPMLRDQVTGPSALRLLDTLEKSAERGSQLVRQILSFAHGVGGEHQLLQVKHLLRDIGAVISGTFPKSIRLESHIRSDLWPVQANPTQIHQVLLNLCVNARDAMPAGGTLRIRGENIALVDSTAAAIPGARPGAFLMIEVEDTGSGIPPEIFGRIWEPFFTTKAAGHGTGLGLSTVRGIVEAHHGFIAVTSVVGAGSRFRVYLPAAEVALPDPAEFALRPHPRGRGELILVVDDEEEIRNMIAEILGRHGYRVISACDGAAASALFEERAAEVRVVLSDLHMPNLDGARLARLLRQRNPAAKMIVMSGMAAGLGDGVDYRLDECVDVLLTKPFRPETLLETVHDLLSDGAASPPSARF